MGSKRPVGGDVRGSEVGREMLQTLLRLFPAYCSIVPRHHQGHTLFDLLFQNPNRMLGGSPQGPVGLRGRDERGTGADEMPTTLKIAAESYLRAKALSRATRNEHLSTLKKWERWGGGIPV